MTNTQKQETQTFTGTVIAVHSVLKNGRKYWVLTVYTASVEAELVDVTLPAKLAEQLRTEWENANIGRDVRQEDEWVTGAYNWCGAFGKRIHFRAELLPAAPGHYFARKVADAVWL